MQVNRLTLTNVRAFQQAEFTFQPGMNLLVGVNGAGKSTVLDVLRVMFSRCLPDFTPSQAPRSKFKPEDNRFGQGDSPQYLAAALEFTINHYPVKLDATYNRFKLKPKAEIIAQEYESAAQSLVVYFSPRRTLVSFSLSGTGISSDLANRQGTPTRYVPDMVRPYLAHDDALKSRELRLSAFAEWWKAREVLSFEDARLGEILEHIEQALETFLPGYHHLRAETVRNRATFLIDKGDVTLDVRQLSDGERNVIALVFDLARRLALANPDSADPMREGSAVVLIDELDLHLHPAWQRTICERLTSTFPNCQFIATTHSPQIIGEVSADSIQMIDNGGVKRPDQSKGMESGWILRELMDVSSRPEETQDALRHIENLIEKKSLSDAKVLIAKLRDLIPDDPELARLQTRLNITDLMQR